MDAGYLLSQLSCGEGGCTLKRSFPWLHSMDAATAMVTGMSTSSLQKEKAIAFLWHHRVVLKGD